MPMKHPTIRSRISALSTSLHTCIHMVLHQLGFCGIPMLQNPASAKPEPWWKRSNFPSVRSTDVERGPVDTFAWLCSGRPYI